MQVISHTAHSAPATLNACFRRVIRGRSAGSSSPSAARHPIVCMASEACCIFDAVTSARRIFIRAEAETESRMEAITRAISVSTSVNPSRV